MAKSTSKKRFVIVGNGTYGYGLYYGETDASDEDIVRNKSVRLENCRNIRYWYGKTGGITSLAAFGPCGPRVAESRIGAPVPSALIMHVVCVYDCTPESVANFAKVTVS